MWNIECHSVGHRTAFYIVKGYNEKRVLWKDSRGFSDFTSKTDAEAKVLELNNRSVAV